MTVLERFLHYVAMDTQSDEASETCPSTAKQLVLGKALVEEMQALGIEDAHMDEHGYVYGTVPGLPGLLTVRLIAHMDTSPDASGENIRARIVEYNGGDILADSIESVLKQSYENLKCEMQCQVRNIDCTLTGKDKIEVKIDEK